MEGGEIEKMFGGNWTGENIQGNEEKLVKKVYQLKYQYRWEFSLKTNWENTRRMWKYVEINEITFIYHKKISGIEEIDEKN